MRWKHRLFTGVAHLAENKIRSCLSILGIFIGVTSVLCMVSIADRAKRIIFQDIEKIGGINQIHFGMRFWIYRGGRRMLTTERLTIADARAIEAEYPSIRYVLPQNRHADTFVTGKDGSQGHPTLVGGTPDHQLALQWEVQEGRFLSENDIDNALQVCVLGNEIARELFQQTPPIGQEIKIRYYWDRPLRMRVVGVMKPKGRSFIFSRRNLDTSLFIPVTPYQQRITGADDVTDLVIFTEKDVDMEIIIQTIYRILRRRHRNKDDFFREWIPKTANERLNHLQNVLKIGFGSIAGFSLFISSVSILNLCLVSIGEKTRGIGLRKSVGAKQVDIFWQFLTEPISLCLCGGVLGIVGGGIAAHVMAPVAVRIVPIVPEWPVGVSLPWGLTAVLFSGLLGIIFGVYPALRAARLSPIDALRTD